MLVRAFLMRQDLLEILQSAGIVRLTQPENGFAANGRIAIRLGYVHQLRHRFVFRQLTQSEDSLFLHGDFGIVFDRVFQGGHRFCTRLLPHPEQGLFAHSGIAVGFGHVDQIVHSGGVVIRGNIESEFFAEFGIGIGLRKLFEDEKAIVTALGAQPEGGLVSQPERVTRRSEHSKLRCSLRSCMHGECGKSLVSQAMGAPCCRQTGEISNAVVWLHVRQPGEGPAAGVEPAPGADEE